MIRYFAAHPTAANLLMLLIIILGLNALPKLQRDTFPLTPVTDVEIRVPYPSATPAEVEESICLRIEDALEGISGLKELRCESRENIAIATATRNGNADLDRFTTDIRTAVDAISQFPTRAEKPSVTELERTANVASIAITGNLPAQQLQAYAEKVRERIKQDPRIAYVNLKGFSEQDIDITLSAHALQRYGLSLTDLQSVIEKQSVDIPSGILSTPDGDLIVRFSDQRHTPAEFADLIVHSDSTGGIIRLGDIASIGTRYNKPEDKVIFNGQRAALLDIIKNQDQDSLRVMDAVKENLVREQAIAPSGITLQISSDVTSNIVDRLRILITNGAEGLVLVFLTMWLFFSFRFSFWVAMGLPVSFLGAVFMMDALGYTLNMMTMVGLLVATGLLMDDAIVISENIATKRQQGLNELEAAIEGTKQVLPGVISSFFTTILVIGPLAFMTGKMGEVLKYIPAILVITLSISLIEAFFILPAHLKHASRSMKHERTGFVGWFDHRFAALRDRFFLPKIHAMIRTPYLYLGLLLALVMFSYATIPAGYLKYQALPTLESDVIQARVLLPQGTPLERTESVVSTLVDSLKVLDDEFSAKQKDNQRLISNITVLYNTHADANESGTHIATISADLLPASERIGSVTEMLSRWRSLTGNVPDTLSVKFTDKERGVAGKAIDLVLQGNQLAQLKNASLELQTFLSQFDGILDLSDDLRLGKPELRIALKSNAGSFGLTANNVASEVRAALYGNTSLEVMSNNTAYDVTVRLDAQDRQYLTDLQYLKIRASDGQLIPLSTVANITETRGYARINRLNGQRSVTVQGSIDPNIANARQIMAQVKKQFIPQLKANYPGIRFLSQGQDKDTADTGNSLETNLFIGLVGIYLILSLQFRNYLEPIAVILAIPMGMIGMVLGHLALGLQLTMPSLVGFATLAGIVVNDNILLVSFTKERLAAGDSVIDAALNAARDRFRPIMITSLTTIAGLLPLLLETSTQAQLLIPLIVSLVFGLMTATLSSLFLVPAWFVILDDCGLRRRID